MSVRAEVGAVGTANDNLMCESFFATLKEELIYRRSWETRHELGMAVFTYIEGLYNPVRRHSRLDSLSPIAYEETSRPERHRSRRTPDWGHSSLR